MGNRNNRKLAAKERPTGSKLSLSAESKSSATVPIVHSGSLAIENVALRSELAAVRQELEKLKVESKRRESICNMVIQSLREQLNEVKPSTCNDHAEHSPVELTAHSVPPAAELVSPIKCFLIDVNERSTQTETVPEDNSERLAIELKLQEQEGLLIKARTDCDDHLRLFLSEKMEQELEICRLKEQISANNHSAADSANRCSTLERLLSTTLSELHNTTNENKMIRAELEQRLITERETRFAYVELESQCSDARHELISQQQQLRNAELIVHSLRKEVKHLSDELSNVGQIPPSISGIDTERSISPKLEHELVKKFYGRGLGLWIQTMLASDLHKLLNNEHWVPDSSSSTCEHLGCTRKFSLLQRRHHCRRCGHLFCDEHSSKKVVLSMVDRRAIALRLEEASDDMVVGGAPGRVCAQCFERCELELNRVGGVVEDDINDPMMFD
ncbi:hypothetical protein BJ742DRAFT_816793 [Cladochytrium replicatum]|nr:hypothetical protein BJ742DRAFT_816793 [Cladochytrium replicatum]